MEGENHVDDGLEEGEILDDEDSRVSKLKYEYKDGQWSPLNQVGAIILMYVITKSVLRTLTWSFKDEDKVIDEIYRTQLFLSWRM